MEAAGASGKQWYQQGQGDDKFQHVRAIMGARPSMMVRILVDLVSVMPVIMPVIMSVIMPAMPPRTILCMIIPPSEAAVKVQSFIVMAVKLEDNMAVFAPVP